MKSTLRLSVCIAALTLLTFHPHLAGQTGPTFTGLYSFTGTGTDGKDPLTGLVQGTNGDFYGTTFGGGSGSDGTVYKVTPAGVHTTLHSFTGIGTDGAFPRAALVQGSDGNFYGTTGGGGSDSLGTVFKMTPAGSLSTLYSFTGTGTDGTYPGSALVEGSDGNFYGTTSGGGSGSLGTIYKITPAGVLNTLHSFSDDGTEGGNPSSGLVRGSDGDLYGTTPNYGAEFSNNPGGTAFKISVAGVFKVLHLFGSGTDGAYPSGELVQGSDGEFYGTTQEGGSSASGTVFKISAGGVLETLHSFAGGTDGASPRAGLVQGSDGNFYGTTYSGGNVAGTIFEITPAGAVTILHVFTDTDKDGAGASAALVQGSDGDFYGTTSLGGGSSNGGTIFKLDTSPKITSATAATATVGKPFTYHITASGSPTSYAVTGLRDGLTLNSGTGVISGTPTTAGTLKLTISATNATGTGTATLTVTVTASAPTITSAPTAAAKVGLAFSYRITASGGPTSYGATNLRDGLSLDPKTGVISGTPTTAGTVKSTISATNSLGTGSAVLTITVAASAPVITSATTASAKVGAAFSYRITATATPTSYSATGLRDGLTLNTATGVISGTPAAAGTVRLTISATNSTGTGSATLTIMVAASAPVITSATTASAKVGTAFSYRITASGSPASYAASGLRDGLSINTSTGVISGAPPTAGMVRLTVSATNNIGTGSATLTITVAAQ